MSGLQLAVDFGTSNTVAVLRWPDNRSQPLLFDGSPMLPSAVFLGSDGQPVTGRHAQRYAGSDPARYEPNPKRCIDDGDVLLGETAVPVVDLIAAVLSRVVAEAVRVGGGTPTRTVLTHPAGWGPRRRELLVTAARQAGMDNLELLAEPLAAAAYFTQVLHRPVPIGSAVMVYDFGGGTFDVSVVQRETDQDWRVLAGDGLPDVGGVDLDHVVVACVAEQLAGTDPAGWRSLSEPTTLSERRYRRMLLDDTREAKEQLSMGSTAAIQLPLLNTETFVTRDEFEQRARPWLDRTVSLTAATLFEAAVPADRIAGIFLVGGASRIPLVATLLHRRLGIAPTIIEQPELVVAQGALDATGLTIAPADTADPAADPVTVGPTTPPTTPPPTNPPPTNPPPQDPPLADPPPRQPETVPPSPTADAETAQPPRRHRTSGWVIIAGLFVTVLTIVIAIHSLVDSGGERPTGGTGSSPVAGASPACTQPDSFLATSPISNGDLFCTPVLKQFAQPFLDGAHCSADGGVAGESEYVSCKATNWEATFTMCASGQPDCPAARQDAKSDGSTVSSETTYRAQGMTGDRIVGSKDGIPFVYWDSDSSAATGRLESTAFEGKPYINRDTLLLIWQQRMS